MPWVIALFVLLLFLRLVCLVSLSVPLATKVWARVLAFWGVPLNPVADPLISFAAIWSHNPIGAKLPGVYMRVGLMAGEVWVIGNVDGVVEPEEGEGKDCGAAGEED